MKKVLLLLILLNLFFYVEAGKRNGTDCENRLPLENYPEPFNPGTTISYKIEVDGPEELLVYDIKGQKIKILPQIIVGSGTQKITWYGFNDSRQIVPSGIYYYHLRSKEGSDTRKMVLMR